MRGRCEGKRSLTETVQSGDQKGSAITGESDSWPGQMDITLYGKCDGWLRAKIARLLDRGFPKIANSSFRRHSIFCKASKLSLKNGTSSATQMTKLWRGLM